MQSLHWHTIREQMLVYAAPGLRVVTVAELKRAFKQAGCGADGVLPLSTVREVAHGLLEGNSIGSIAKLHKVPTCVVVLNVVYFYLIVSAW